MAGTPDSHPVVSLDSRRNPRASLDSAAPDHFSGGDSLAVGLGAAVDLFLAAKAAEGASPNTGCGGWPASHSAICDTLRCRSTRRFADAVA